MSDKKILSGSKFMFLGLLTFFTLGMDLFITPIDKLLWGNMFNVENFFDNTWYMLTIHWSMVIILWVIGGVLVFMWLNKRKVVNNVISMHWGIDLLPILIVAAVTSILFTVLEAMMFSSILPQFLNEYQSFSKVHGPMGFLVSLFQNIYYLVESMLVVLLLALMQRAGELWFKRGNFPYGGVGLLLTWGLGHFTKGIIDVLWICGFCLVFGWLFVKAKKRWWASLLFLWLIFLV